MSDTPLTHFDESGRAAMVDVSSKDSTDRKAIASGSVTISAQTLAIVKAGPSKKGDVRAISELAGIMGAKLTSQLIPLCHPLPLTKVSARIEIDEDLPGFTVVAETKTTGQTGVEMEALTAVSVACLTLYDMLKAVDKSMVISDIKLLKKTGGRSGTWSRHDG